MILKARSMPAPSDEPSHSEHAHDDLITDAERERFDALVEEALEELPPQIRDLLEEVPLIVIDAPSPTMLRDLGCEPRGPDEDDLRLEFCGLHSGQPYTEPGLDAPPELPGTIHLFRAGIIAHAGGWGDRPVYLTSGPVEDGFEDDTEDTRSADDRVYEEIMITLLHEIGHQFGLDEDDLFRLGYD